MDEDLQGRERVATVTWALFDVSDVLGDIMLAYEGEDPGEVMLKVMHTHPEAIADDFLDWLDARRGKARLVVSGFFNPADSDKVKEQYLAFVNRLAEDVGQYNIMHSTLSIKRVSL